jgi:hypothetical protein
MAFCFKMSSHFDLKNIRIEAATGRDAARLVKFIKAYYRFDRLFFDKTAKAWSSDPVGLIVSEARVRIS